MSDKPVEQMDNDEKIAAGHISRYTRSCACGAQLQFGELPGPSKCPACLSKESIPSPAAAAPPSS